MPAMRQLIVLLCLNLVSLINADASLYPAKAGFCPAPSVVEVYQSDVTVTEWTTHTAYAPCVDCIATSATDAAAYAITDTPTSVSSTALWSQPTPPTSTQTLYPAPHWDHDTTSPDVLVPKPDTNSYYAPSDAGDANTAHSFQWINATLSSPAVVLDHSSLLTYSWLNATSTLTINFTSHEAFDLAQSSWNTSMIFVAYTKGCGGYESGDSCYVAVTSLIFYAESFSCQATGVTKTLHECLNSMTASWGQYVPAQGDPNPVDHKSVTSSIFSSVLSQYPAYSAELSSYFYASIYDGSGRSSKTSTSYIPAGIVTSAPSGWESWADAAPSTTRGSDFPVSTTAGSHQSGYDSNHSASSDRSSYSSSAITAPPSTPTSLSPSVSRISYSLSSYLSSMSASYASYSSGDASSSSHTTQSSSRTTSSESSISTSSNGSTMSFSTEDNDSTSTTSDSSAISSDSSTTSDESTSTSSPTSANGSESTTASSTSDESTSSGQTSTSTLTSTTSSTSTDSTTSSSIPLPTCVNQVPSSCASLIYYDGDDLFSPSLGCSLDLSNLVSSEQISAGSLQPAYGCFNVILGSTLSGVDAANCVVNAIVCESAKTTFTTTTTTTRNPLTTTTTTTSSGTSTVSCTPGVDQLYGLRTYCAGTNFDAYLDSIDGLLTLSQTDFAQLVQLFPGLFPSLSRRFTQNEIDKRCDFFDCLSTLSSGIGGVVDSATSFFNSITDAAVSTLSSEANNIKSSALAKGQELSDAAAAAIAALVDALATTVDKTGHIDIDIAPPDSAKVDSPWGSQVLIHSFGKGEAESAESGQKLARRGDFALNVFCVDCSIKGTVDLHGTLTVDVDGIHELTLNTELSDLEVNLGIGLHAEAAYEKTFRLNLFQQGIPELCSGTTLCIGPYVKMDAELTIGVEAEGYLLAGGTWTFTDAQCELNAYEGSQSARNWSPSFSPNINAGGEVTLSATVGMPLSVGVGITILNGAISKNIDIEVKPTVTGTATAAVEISHDDQGTVVDGSQPDCDGIYVTSFWEVVLSYNILDLKEDDLYDTGEQPIAAACIPWDTFIPKEDKADGSSNTGFGEGSGLGSTSASSVQLVDTSDNSALQICNDGNVYKVPPGFSAADCSSKWIGYVTPQSVEAAYSAGLAQIRRDILDATLHGRPWTGPLFPDRADITSKATSVIASGSRRIAVMFPAYASSVFASRLRIVDVNRIPAMSEYVSFDYVDDTHGRLARNLGGGPSYTAVQCKAADATSSGSKNPVFLVVTDMLIGGVALLNSERLAGIVSNGDVTECQPMNLQMISIGS